MLLASHASKAGIRLPQNQDPQPCDGWNNAAVDTQRPRHWSQTTGSRRTPRAWQSYQLRSCAIHARHIELVHAVYVGQEHLATRIRAFIDFIADLLKARAAK